MPTKKSKKSKRRERGVSLHVRFAPTIDKQVFVPYIKSFISANYTDLSNVTRAQIRRDFCEEWKVSVTPSRFNDLLTLAGVRGGTGVTVNPTGDIPGQMTLPFKDPPKPVDTGVVEEDDALPTGVKETTGIPRPIVDDEETVPFQPGRIRPMNTLTTNPITGAPA